MPFNSRSREPAEGMRPNAQSRMQWPPSVTNAPPSGRSRRTGLPPKLSIRRAVDCHPNGITSTGTTPQPSRSTSFDSSATITSRALALATIFSRSSAPPRPLIKFSVPSSTSSAPSIVKSTRGWSESVESGMPSARACSAVRSEVGIPTMRRPCRMRAASGSRISDAVEPVPSPTTITSSISATAQSAAAFLSFTVRWSHETSHGLYYTESDGENHHEDAPHHYRDRGFQLRMRGLIRRRKRCQVRRNSYAVLQRNEGCSGGGAPSNGARHRPPALDRVQLHRNVQGEDRRRRGLRCRDSHIGSDRWFDQTGQDRAGRPRRCGPHRGWDRRARRSAQVRYQHARQAETNPAQD